MSIEELYKHRLKQLEEKLTLANLSLIMAEEKIGELETEVEDLVVGRYECKGCG